MKGPIKYLFFIYQWLVILPLAVLLTGLTALITIIFASISKNPKIHALPAQYWSKAICFISFVKVSIEGIENIDHNTSYVFAANHQSPFDIWVVYGWLPRPFSWIIKKELRKVPLAGLACEKIGHIFVNRKNPQEAKKSMAKAKEILQNGQCLVIFPEGTRSYDGKVGPFKRGAFHIASDLQLPIVPITIVGAYEIMSRHVWHMKPGQLKMVIHKPIACNNVISETEIRKLSEQTREVIISGFAK